MFCKTETGFDYRILSSYIQDSTFQFLDSNSTKNTMIGPRIFTFDALTLPNDRTPGSLKEINR